MSVEIQRQMTMMLIIAMLVGADASQVQQSARFGYDMTQMGESIFHEEANFCHKKMDEMLTDPQTLVKAKHVAQQMEALMAVPTVQEQVKVFAERVDANFQEQMKLVTQNMEMMQPGEPNFQKQAKRVEEQMKATLAKSVTNQMEALTADPSFQEQAKMLAAQMQTTFSEPKTQAHAKPKQIQNFPDNIVDKMLDQRLKTFSFEQASLENTMLRKPSSPAVQPRMGVQSSMIHPSIRASPARRTIASALQNGKSSIVRAGAVKRRGTGKTVARRTLRNRRKEDPYSDPAKRLLDSFLTLETASALGDTYLKPFLPEGELPDLTAGLPAWLKEDEFLSEEVEGYIKEAAFLFFRLAAASVMIHHGQEKILSAEAFTKFAIDKYFTFLPAIEGKRVFWAYFSGGVQAVGPILLSLGVFSRLAAVSLAGTMVGATYYSVVSTGLEGFPLSKMAAKVPVFHNYGFETPILYLAIFALVAAAGPGKLSVAEALGWNDDKTLLGKIKQ
jgi:uncharacterized membrane protein YphA (DoxX/SURF4 family)